MSLFKNMFAKKNKSAKSYEDFWLWFEKNQKQFFNTVKTQDNVEANFLNELSSQLQEIKQGFYFLTGMSDDNTAELILTADGDIKNIPFVQELVNHAPHIDGWLFTALKPASDIKDVSIDMAGYEFNEDNISFYQNEDPTFPDEIDITIVYDSFNKKDESKITNGISIFLENFIGELNFATLVDSFNVIGKSDAQNTLVPIAKLKDYLIWRQKEFIEKYEGIRQNTENDTYSSFSAELKNGNSLVAVINTDLLNWDSKPSHPWIIKIEIPFDGSKTNGMPNTKTYKLLNVIEDEILEVLNDSDGYLNIGRETADGVREIYFACKDFHKPSKVLFAIEQKYSKDFVMSYDIYRDKYWHSFNRYMS